MKRILIVDDNATVIAAARLSLEAAGFSVDSVSDPEKFSVANEEKFDLILMDVSMPEVLGDDVAAYFREAWGVAVPIYLYSGLDEDELRQRAKDAGADGFICKVWGAAALVEQVQKALGEG